MLQFLQKVLYSMLALKCQVALNIKYYSIILYDILCRLTLLCEYFFELQNRKYEN